MIMILTWLRYTSFQFIIWNTTIWLAGLNAKSQMSGHFPSLIRAIMQHVLAINISHSGTCHLIRAINISHLSLSNLLPKYMHQIALFWMKIAKAPYRGRGILPSSHTLRGASRLRAWSLRSLAWSRPTRYSGKRRQSPWTKYAAIRPWRGVGHCVKLFLFLTPAFDIEVKEENYVDIDNMRWVNGNSYICFFIMKF